MSRDTDRDWEAFGRSEPYWAVLTDEKFKLDKLTSQTLEDFFSGGDAQISWTFDQIRRHIDPEFDPAVGLDFGCGVGRLTFPLARRCRSVTGVDVSAAMLEKAREHAKQFGLDNVAFVKGDDALSAVEGPFDFINTFVVLQHIPADRGERIFRRLLELLRDGGVGALHLTYSKQYYWKDTMHRPPIGVKGTLAAFGRELKRRLLPGGKTTPVPVGGASTTDGLVMQMNDYHLNRVFHFLQEAGVREMVVHLSDHNGDYGALLIFRKRSGQGYLV